MLDSYPVAVDVTQEQTILNALPLAPIISSATKGWNKIQLRAINENPTNNGKCLTFTRG
ncbi:hypothetical protein NIES4071_33910 [Calothrix sp. NIES-4071]|nr:hypothetical protein NIES4071_33910 [Calothrix sp. NIES-4071]BAZ57710.1 hypothetical protein NIES4105_33840 [Calothrix sp. NIES-4105]